jgi:hypothetical protein
MNNVIKLESSFIGCDSLTNDDLSFGVTINVWSDVGDFLIQNQHNEDMSSTIFGIKIESIKDNNKAMHIDVEIDELELFANSVLKHIEIVRNNYKDEIQKQTKLGNAI